MAGTITALRVQKYNKERVNVFLDDEFAFGLAMIHAMTLKKGQHLSDAKIAELEALDAVEVAKDKALNYLSYRPRSTDEVRRSLRDKDFAELTIETVIDKLERAGLVDDLAFARFWVENRERFKPRSARALRYELRQKGVADRIIDQALEGFDEVDAAYRAARKKLRRYRNADEETFRRKMSGYLQRRGFSYAIVRDVLDDVWQETQHK